jgi:two-component system OmpR family response regulator
VTVPKILIVEADDDLRHVLLDATEDRFDVEAVRSGAAMRAAFARGEPDVVLLNMSLPADDAVALADRAAQRGCVVIVVPEEPSQFTEAASRGYYILVRPLTRRRVGETIERALRRAMPTRA